jgi:2-keto-4-pentenoate hydratase/2-oxohepta-3-ene-1,7-dioic acid hydratase in catechol pathway
VIIGTTARQTPREGALKHVFGYSVMIDVSARDNRRAGQWIFSKGMDTFAPFGPCIVTADEIPDPQVLDLWLTVNGVEKQRSNTSKMLFKVDELISDLSRGITLEPGDIIASGTPEGVGAGRDPQEWMWPGDVMEAHVEGIGTIRHPIIDGLCDPAPDCVGQQSVHAGRGERRALQLFQRDGAHAAHGRDWHSSRPRKRLERHGA